MSDEGLRGELADARARIAELQAAADSKDSRLARVESACLLGCWEWNASENTMAWSDAMYRLFGVSSGVFDPNASEAVRALIHPEDAQRVTEAMQRAIESGESLSVEYRVCRPDATEAYVLATGSVAKTSDGHHLLSGMTRDLSDERSARVERDKQQAQRLRAEKLRGLGNLAGGIAHDFNNRLFGVVGGADLALRGLPAESPVREHLEVVISSAARCVELTDQILAYSGDASFFVEGIELRGKLRDLGPELRSLISNSTTLELKVPTGLPNLVGDRSQLRQLIINLVVNAAESIGEDGGRITLAAYTGQCRDQCPCQIPGGEPWSLGSSRLTLEVTDTGCGMNAATKAQIFEPFFTTKTNGRGLGLAAVHGILRGHNAGVVVESEPGQGTSIKLQFATVDHVDDAEHEISAEICTTWEGSGTVLFVDDQPLVRQVGERLLQRLGFSVLTAADGIEALDLVRKQGDEIVCVVLDLLMPKMGGEETFAELRKLRADLPVLLSSGYADEAVFQELAEQGIAGFIHKPYTTADLRSKLRAALEPPTDTAAEQSEDS